MHVKEENLTPLKENWTVAEMEVSYNATAKIDVSVNSCEKAYKIFLEMWDKPMINVQEHLAALYVNRANKVVAYRHISSGALSGITVDIPLILTCALLSRSSGIILAHNHPSGNLEPSMADLEATINLKKSAETMGMTLLDHLIITPDNYYSFVVEGLLD